MFKRYTGLSQLPLKQKGFTLIELLIGGAVGLSILGGLSVLLSHFSQASVNLTESARLDYELQSAMSLMSSDIRRAGMTSTVSTMISGASYNPFMTNAADLQVPSSTCILFSYDKNKSGLLPALNTAGGDNRFGYRLSNGILQARALSDSVFSCNAGTWGNLTNPNLIEINTFTVTLSNTPVFLNGIDASGGQLIKRSVNLTLSGRLKKDNTFTKSLSETILVRNDKYVP